MLMLRFAAQKLRVSMAPGARDFQRVSMGAVWSAREWALLLTFYVNRGNWTPEQLQRAFENVRPCSRETYVKYLGEQKGDILRPAPLG